MTFTFSKRSLDRLGKVDQRLQQLMHNAIALSPIDFGIPEYGGLRTEEEQQQLYQKGLSKCDGYKIKSYHQTGNAIDIYAYVNGKASWDKIHLAIIAGVILGEANRMNLNVRWGGTFGSDAFKGWDMPHFELSTV
ncbi:M15 family metallopeptidase [Marinifilum fragile]|uniref:M15 family metallopeptidase n=1 Tax=Marinifilum fragile TaxID=570161 RepID=UPI0006D09AE7|nr:M15 family metallopeptidase [Marinifilum fragile]